ncbi:MAG: protein kinase [Deltaproteobacteria bacterium]|nr:protein kinase [Deltaproteobacteria bacterium]
MAELYLARVEGQDAPVVLKRGRKDADPRIDALLRTEAALWLPLQHPNLVRALDLVQINERPCLLMELVEGVSLAQVQQARNGRPLSPAMAAYLCREIAGGLSHVHAARPPTVHGDVTASNILLSRTGQVKLGDFGIAEPAGAIRTTGELRGQAGHVAPETLQGAPADVRSDLFQLGLLLAELLQGGPLFASDDEQAALSALLRFQPKQLEKPELAPPGLWRIVVQLLQPDPDRRLAHAHEALEALVEFAAPVGKPQVAALLRHALPDWRSPLDVLNGEPPPPKNDARAQTEPALAPAKPPDVPWETEPLPTPPPVRQDSPTPAKSFPARLESPTPAPGEQEPLPESPTPAHAFELEPPADSPTPAHAFTLDGPPIDIDALQARLRDELTRARESRSEPDTARPGTLARVALETGLILLSDLELAALPLPPLLLKRLPRAWAERLRAIPIAADASTILVAMAEPEPKRLMETIRSVTGCSTVRGILASPGAIAAAIERGYEAAGLRREALLKL